MDLDPEEQILCPFNSAHHIRRKHMDFHLVKCKKNYSEAQLVECDFNVGHKIPKSELQYHHMNCPDRSKIEIAFYQEEGTDLNKFPIHNVHVPSEESWDNLNVSTYDPEKYCERKEVIRQLKVESKSKRNEFKMSERKRLEQFTNIQPKESARESQSERQTSSETSRRNLPEVKTTAMDEKTPDLIATMREKVHIGARKAFIQADNILMKNC